jgi:hypothetical protein
MLYSVQFFFAEVKLLPDKLEQVFVHSAS